VTPWRTLLIIVLGSRIIWTQAMYSFEPA